MIEKVKLFLDKYEKALMPATLFLGFIVDSITLNRVDQLFDNLILLFYIFLASASIVLMYSKDIVLRKISSYEKLGPFIPYVMQYALGGLFSGLLIFYFRSGSIHTSLPFLIVLFFLLISNDLFKKLYQKFRFQISVLFIAILSYSNLIVPVLMKEVGLKTFIIGCILSVLIILFIDYVLFKFLPNQITNKSKIYQTLGSILTIFVILYLTNIIPPIPLSMKNGGAFYSVSRSTETYTLTTEQKPWYLFWDRYINDLYIKNGEPVYVFSSIFAPTDLKSTIFHKWQYFDEENNKWVLTDKIPINIVGGRDQGFRGFSKKQQLSFGRWRVDVVTNRDQVIGRIDFSVNKGQTDNKIDIRL